MTSNIVPYNRFDKLPPHALRCHDGSVSTSTQSSPGSSESDAASILDRLQRELYIEKTPPPPYIGQSRSNLPKKSEAAQKIAELLKEAQKAFGMCYSCERPIATASDACEAMGHIYHNRCFTCFSCGRTLREKTFYSIHDRIYCEEDYMYSGFQQTVEKCHSCGHLIMDLALGKSFHPGCFRCTDCNECLDGVPFTVDVSNRVYCITDFHKLFAPKCAACGLSIVPINSSDETVRVVALDKDFHIDCYHCEGCKIQLTDEIDKRCYPIGDHLFCYNCHIEVRGLNLPSPSSSTSSGFTSASIFTIPKSLHNGSMAYSPSSMPSHNSSKTYSPISLPPFNGSRVYSPVSSPSNSDSPPPDISPNNRLQDKIRHHMTANKGFKLSSPLASPTRQIPPAHFPPTPTRQLSPVTRNSPEPPAHRLSLPNLHSAPIDLPNPLRRNIGQRRRLPLSDMIMHKRIADSLKKSTSRLSGNEVGTPPQANTPPRPSPTRSSPGRRSPQLSALLASHIGRSVSAPPQPASPPYYMKAWQASEVALESHAVEHKPVVAQELPPRLPARATALTDNNTDSAPKRPPKLIAYHLANV